MKKLISENPDALSEEVAKLMVHFIKETLKKQDRFTIALSGGSTPKKLYKLLSSDEYRDQIDWPKLHFFWGDERYVPFEDEKNNARMSFEELLNKVPADRDNVHVMRTDISPEESAVAYEEILHDYFDASTTSFDLVLLGLGDNAHTLSLFPGYKEVHEMSKWVTSFYLAEQEMYRITLTAAIVNKSICIAFLVAGADKAEAVKQILELPVDLDKYPAQVIKADKGEVYWFLDRAAAKSLKD